MRDIYDTYYVQTKIRYLNEELLSCFPDSTTNSETMNPKFNDV